MLLLGLSPSCVRRLPQLRMQTLIYLYPSMREARGSCTFVLLLCQLHLPIQSLGNHTLLLLLPHFQHLSLPFIAAVLSYTLARAFKHSIRTLVHCCAAGDNFSRADLLPESPPASYARLDAFWAEPLGLRLPFMINHSA
jgi:hypothetical protein